jgi:hypothetical protein
MCSLIAALPCWPFFHIFSLNSLCCFLPSLLMSFAKYICILYIYWLHCVSKSHLSDSSIALHENELGTITTDKFTFLWTLLFSIFCCLKKEHHIWKHFISVEKWNRLEQSYIAYQLNKKRVRCHRFIILRKHIKTAIH